MMWLYRTVEKLDIKDDRVRSLEEEGREVQQKTEAQRREFAERMEVLTANKEMMLTAVSHCVTYLWYEDHHYH